jgi:hypothetical protein
VPINLLWQPSNHPPTNDQPEQLGLELGGDDASVAPSKPGRVKLWEVPDKAASTKGQDENPNPRLIATFHGTFFYNTSSPAQTRLTFGILIKSGSHPGPHDQRVEGFDPECMFGVDAIVLTFVNRRFVVYLPFYVDTRSEGKFLDVQAIAEVDASGSGVTELGKSAVLSLGIRRTHAVDTTSEVNGSPLTYTDKLVGNVIVCQEDYLLGGQVRDPAQSTPSQIVTTPKLVPVSPAGSAAARFQPYVAGSMQVMLATNLLDNLAPSSTQISSHVTGVGDPAAAATAARARLRVGLAAALAAILTDAGFAGAVVDWQDAAALSALAAAFTASFVPNAFGGNFWRLGNPDAPFVTSFWNFVVTHSDNIQVAGVAEQRRVDPNPHPIAGQSVYLDCPLPIGSGNKQVRETTRLNAAVFSDVLLNASGLARQFATPADFDRAVDKLAAHVAMAAAHEIGHSLGLMHTAHVESSGNYSERNGSPVMTIMSEGMDSGGFGTNMRFAAQAKVIWATAFGVSPTYADPSLVNKTWSTAEVPTLGWQDRLNRFLHLHDEPGMARPGWTSSDGVPPFAKAPPAAQKGTKI